MSDYKAKKSSSSWETSYYGGYTGLIYDHPDVKLSWDVELEIPGTELGFYTKKKLLEIFLIKVKEQRLVAALVKNSTEITRKGYFFGKDKKYMIANKDQQKKVLECLINKEPEYSSLFVHYQKTILNSDVMVEVLEPDQGEGGKGKSKSKSKEDGTGVSKGKGKPSDEEEEGDAESEQEKNARMAAQREYMKRMLEKTAKKEKWSPSKISNFSGKASWLYPKGAPKSIYLPSEESLANSLVKMLDITFDPQQDRINSLRTGKLDTRKVAEVLPGNLNVYYKVEEDQSTKPFSVVILADESGSMRGKMKKTRSLVKILYLAFSQILPKNKLYVLGHSGPDYPEIFVYQDPHHDNFDESIETMAGKQENYDGPVIEEIHKKIREYTDDNIIFIVLSDGAPSGDGYGSSNDVKDLKRIVEKCRRDGFVTVGVGVEYDTSHLYDYNCIVSSMSNDMVKRASFIINKVVKTEFQ